LAALGQPQSARAAVAPNGSRPAALWPERSWPRAPENGPCRVLEGLRRLGRLTNPLRSHVGQSRHHLAPPRFRFGVARLGDPGELEVAAADVQSDNEASEARLDGGFEKRLVDALGEDVAEFGGVALNTSRIAFAVPVLLGLVVELGGWVIRQLGSHRLSHPPRRRTERR
jgi:hypothetical protein